MAQKAISLLILFCISHNILRAQNPIITSWLQNTTLTGKHYVSGNSTPIVDATLANVQSVKYSNNWSYITTQGIPTYVTGPFLDNNPSIATGQNAIFKIPRNPVQNTGNPTATVGGNNGIFINGVALFDYRDGVSWSNSAGAWAGGPGGGMGDGVWNRDAIVAERVGFDCAKGHPAMGNYHHHQNPSAFNLDLSVISTVCNLYVSDGLYTIDASQHSPLLGFAYDGFPIYGAYGYLNTNGTGGITRIKSSFVLRSITTRNTYYTSSTIVTQGPPINATYPLGVCREDYRFNDTLAAQPGYLDIHNGRFCVTPEYPNGIYCYFTTVNANWNSAYPYVIGPTFYGVKTAVKVTNITETVTTYLPPTISITASNSTICAGSSATFTATATNGGISPTYQWKKNGLNVGTNSTSYTTNTLANSDVITCKITTAILAVATSNSITMIVNPLPIVNASNVIGCSGSSISLLGSPSGGMFSLPNPYSGSSTTYTYTFINSNGCSATSSSANITVSNCFITLNLKSFIQGFYSSSNTMVPVLLNQGIGSNNLLCDTITVELHNAISPYALAYSHKGVLSTIGLLSCSFPVATLGNNYYIVVKHRNSIETWSASPVLISNNMSYDFSTSDTQAYGNNQIQMQNGVWAFYTGDIDQDGSIDNSDFSLWETDANNFATGYLLTDIDGNGSADNADFSIWETNANSFISEVIP
jgi:hypothetical protein